MVATALERGAPPRTAAILALVGFAIAAPAMALRPQLFGIVLFALLVWLGRRSANDGPGRISFAPVVDRAVGPTSTGASCWGRSSSATPGWADVAAGRPSRTSLVVLVAGTLATLVNPFGIGAWTYAANIGVNPAISGQVTEWQRTSPLAVPGILFYPAVVVTVALMARRRALVALARLGAPRRHDDPRRVGGPRRRVVPVHDGPPAGAGAGGCARRRAANLRERRDRDRPRRPRGGRPPVVAAAGPAGRSPGAARLAPSRLAQAVAELPAGARVVTPQTWGSWFEWAAPDARYFIDSRFELFPAEVWTILDAARDRCRRGRRGAGSLAGGRRRGPGRRRASGRGVDTARERHRWRGLHEGPMNGPVPSGGASDGTSLVESRPMRHDQ